MIKAIKKLWRFATCDHWNACRSLAFEDSTELNFCTRCGRLLWFTDEGSRRHNPHLLRDRLDDNPASEASSAREEGCDTHIV